MTPRLEALSSFEFGGVPCRVGGWTGLLGGLWVPIGSQ